MGLLLYLIIGGIIGWFASLVLEKDMPGGVVGNVIAGIVGAWIGGRLLGNWGPKLADFYLIPAIIGALIFVIILGFVMKSTRKRW
ncbi:GlsB/YeaQ/YmgE family stress response membrane protein [Sporosarcina sp. 6E9]|uniref:GlsB/YeaQ/YmgE family stress response membrane protein n=1 Tax=Sporosarcina sp. 6E9 TaxID=2819235 RepID=UPI001AC5D3AC|nr:GlsB/YeaQ/YmgE family stress response membrane protein [Sporosarcina sp. 6E9]MBO1910396.1 GlsB/YeaQ/YmgE family stress response membrane protein [Microvirga sp. 3-52]